MVAHNALGYDTHLSFTKISEKCENSVTFIFFIQKKFEKVKCNDTSTKVIL